MSGNEDYPAGKVRQNNLSDPAVKEAIRILRGPRSESTQLQDTLRDAGKIADQLGITTAVNKVTTAAKQFGTEAEAAVQSVANSDLTQKAIAAAKVAFATSQIGIMLDRKAETDKPPHHGVQKVASNTTKDQNQR